MTQEDAAPAGGTPAPDPSTPVGDEPLGLPVPRPPVADVLDGWDREQRQFAALLREDAPGAEWLERLEASRQRQASLALSHPDAAIYLLLQAAVHAPDRYSAHHSMLCAVVGEICGRLRQWPDAERVALQRAALTMNLSMSSLQDALARQTGPLTSSQREQVKSHAERSADMLAEGGVTDALWLEAVRAHHDAVPANESSQPARRLATLLQRVDVYTAKLSRRVSREPMSPALAARQVCLDDRQQPDALGATVLRAVGVYPPGCCVRLANDEIGVVIARGAKAHTPLVAALRRGDGGLFLPPARRDTSLARHAITMGLPARALNVRIDNLRTLTCG